jgi:hypothetical protein
MLKIDSLVTLDIYKQIFVYIVAVSSVFNHV